MAEAIRKKVTREVDQLLLVIFQGRRKTGAVEMAVPSAMRRAGAAALSELLDFPAPAQVHHTAICRVPKQPLIESCTPSRC